MHIRGVWHTYWSAISPQRKAKFQISQAGGRCVHTCPQNFGKIFAFSNFLRAEAKFSKSVNFPINFRLSILSQFLSERKPTSEQKDQFFWKSLLFEKMVALTFSKTKHSRWKIMILEVLSRYTCSGWPQMHSDVIPWPYILGKVLSLSEIWFL